MERVTTHPGEMLQEEFLKPLNLSVTQAARRAQMPVKTLNEIVQQRRPVTAEVALRLERMFGMSAEFWLRLQQTHDLTQARLDSGDAIAAAIEPVDMHAAA